jgi:flagellar biosynthetic protein FlhB
MADSEDKESKTENPTEKKLRDAVEKGNLPFSREAPIFASFLAILIFALFFADKSAVHMARFLANFLDRPEEFRLGTAQDVVALYRAVLVEVVKLFGVVMILLMVGGIAASVLQNVPRFVLDRIAPKMSRISLGEGWRRLFGVKGWVEFLKSVGKVGLGVACLVFALSGVRERLLSGMLMEPAAFGLMLRSITIHIIAAIAFAVALIAAADLFWSRFSWFSDLKMSRQEIKDEFKQTDGDPIVKMRLRSLARDRARRRMMQAVPKATLVIANPTHYAIALNYIRDRDAAPVVVAKGQDLLALRIREIAEEHNVPVFEDVALARSMYKQVSVGSMIPSQFYQAVAELVRVVYSKSPPRTAGNQAMAGG